MTLLFSAGIERTRPESGTRDRLGCVPQKILFSAARLTLEADAVDETDVSIMKDIQYGLKQGQKRAENLPDTMEIIYGKYKSYPIRSGNEYFKIRYLDKTYVFPQRSALTPEGFSKQAPKAYVRAMLTFAERLVSYVNAKKPNPHIQSDLLSVLGMKPYLAIKRVLDRNKDILKSIAGKADIDISPRGFWVRALDSEGKSYLANCMPFSLEGQNPGFNEARFSSDFERALETLPLLAESLKEPLVYGHVSSDLILKMGLDAYMEAKHAVNKVMRWTLEDGRQFRELVQNRFDFRIEPEGLRIIPFCKKGAEDETFLIPYKSAEYKSIGQFIEAVLPQSERLIQAIERPYPYNNMKVDIQLINRQGPIPYIQLKHAFCDLGGNSILEEITSKGSLKLDPEGLYVSSKTAEGRVFETFFPYGKDYKSMQAFLPRILPFALGVIEMRKQSFPHVFIHPSLATSNQWEVYDKVKAMLREERNTLQILPDWMRLSLEGRRIVIDMQRPGSTRKVVELPYWKRLYVSYTDFLRESLGCVALLGRSSGDEGDRQILAGRQAMIQEITDEPGTV